MPSLKGLIIPVIIILTISFISFFYLLYITVNKSDESYREIEARILRTYINKYSENIAIFAEDNAWWSASYENVVEKPNVEWIASNISQEELNFDGLFLYGADNSILYSSLNVDLPDNNKFLKSDLEDLLKSLTIDDYYNPKTLSAIQIIDNRFFRWVLV
tara:strand:- start:63816 stop:64295 length:480 start_codon:yes stop_codon:yes gene_type:complete